MYNNIPKYLQINSEISMYQDVSESCHRFPICFWKLFLEIIAYTLNCFPDDFKVAIYT